MSASFHSLYRHGFVRTAVAIPHVTVADPARNASETLRLAQQASARGAAVVVFPELGLTGYAIDDLLQQDAILDAALDGLAMLRDQTRDLAAMVLVGLPLRFEARLFNCAVVLHRGQILGVVPKTYLPNYREYYEKRHFSSSTYMLQDSQELLGEEVPVGSDLTFRALDLDGFVLHVELCEDLWTPIPPSTWGALSGATVLCNLSASNVTIDKAEYRRSLVLNQSAQTVSAYLYAGAGAGESTTDLAWDGHGMIAEYGELLSESQRFQDESQIIYADVDLERLVQERSRLSSFNDTVAHYRDRYAYSPIVEFALDLADEDVELERDVPRFPYVPDSAERLSERCSEAYNIQVHGLAKRLEATGIERLVIGISGGLDSTHALIVAVKAMDRLGLPRDQVLAYTMPGYATSDHTRDNAHALMTALGVSGQEIDIRPSCDQMLRDIGHPFADGEPVHDVTFENVQAGERTSHLFRLANLHKGLVVGTGDLSELALGWATYGVGDHMSHYNPNGSVPKTLIQHLIRWVIATDLFCGDANRVLQSIVDTEISPELVPASADATGDRQPAQKTEEIIGPYELQDFNLYYLTRYGFRPSKVAFLSHHAWNNVERGNWPTTLPLSERREYDLPEIKRWLRVFLQRFFGFSQFKRSALPNGPKVGSGGSLSPRGDWRAPSDSKADAWLSELDSNVP
jgi:NAD+ synthase (glutamine-hydrolysing)